MSWINCDSCGEPVNSDNDPDCFGPPKRAWVGADGIERIEWEVLCERCREKDDG